MSSRTSERACLRRAWRWFLRTARREMARLTIALNFAALKVLPRRASSFLPIDENKTTHPMKCVDDSNGRRSLLKMRTYVKERERKMEVLYGDFEKKCASWHFTDIFLAKRFKLLMFFFSGCC
ncbi:hypothetical protein V8G54_013932 [Vigna mungo]|uniref:Uncharacterized protein n=1 Tax=Vigna mungo TaxID=3915 RepID=A0AAQ3NGR6_VIGMU